MFGFSNRFRPKKRHAPPGLHSAAEMERLLVKERFRCDRYEHIFSLVIIHFNLVPEVTRTTQEIALARYLSTKLRLIDDFGYLRNGGFGVLLPMTDLAGGKVVLGKILDYANQHGLSIEADVFSYCGRLNNSEPDLFRDDLDDTPPHENHPGMVHADELMDRISSFRENWDSATKPNTRTDSANPVELARPSRPSDGVTVEAKTSIVRADLDTQTRMGNLVELLRLCSKPYPKWKRQLDILGASIGLLTGLPILIAAGLAIKLNSRGPVFFKQSRCGQFGEPFVIYKLRTMSNDAEQTKHLLEDLNERDGPAFKIKDDPRVTLVGKFLRATGIDELPQLINVLKGDMAIVGPRPLPLGEERECSTWQQRRLDTKPGITCLWQISKSRQMTFDEWMRLDLHYLKKRSLVYDASLLVRTVKAVLMGRVGH